MARVKIGDIDIKERKQITSDLFEVITDAKTKKETVGFLMGLLSASEILMLARRVQIAQLLLDDMSYREISKKIHVSESTVASVARWLYDEENKIFKAKIEKLKKGNRKSIKKQQAILSPYAQLRALQEIINNKM